MGDHEQDNDGSASPKNHSSDSTPAEAAIKPNHDASPSSSWRHSLLSFTWANFTCTQSTGGIAILLSETPHQFYGLHTAGLVIFLLNLVLFTLFVTAITTRFILRPSLLRKSLVEPPEAYFTGSALLSVATIIICIQRYAVDHTGEWVLVAVRVLFWLYAAVTLLYNTVIFAVMFAVSKSLRPDDAMHPAMFLTVFVTMLTGTVAANIAEGQPPEQRLPIIVAGVAYQGLGWTLAMLLLPRFLASLLVHGVGAPDLRPGLFMPVGSSGYTIVSLIGCARAIPEGYAYFGKHPAAAETLRAVALWAGIFLWLFTFWLFVVALLVNLPVMFPRVSLGGGGRWRVSPRMRFTLPWWAMVFPNVGFTVGTAYIGEELESQGIMWVATGMTILVFGVWLMDLGLHMKRIMSGKIS